MNSLKNNVRLVGRIGTDFNIRTFESGKKLVSVPLATNETYYNNDGEKITTSQWHTICLWNNRAEKAQKMLSKGSLIILDGKLINRSYEKDGSKKYITEIHVHDFFCLDSKS
ncbi:MAG: single-stranded DNA-binding protein [Cyclobacteriaceae bacterium]|jgi:single-strand DNA-binding protein|nr:single-stranded DNA-binding protein [Cyclobacteriaceae bacterium SS2]|tara:strand:- start:195 stop:530 length:336 start_codon:yes stop_codon:yes gene_type:complete